MMDQCLTFDPVYQPRLWGGHELRRLFGRPIPESETVGESWELVDRPEAQSVVNFGVFRGTSLQELWQTQREPIFGAGLEAPRFPLLFKLIDAAEALSIQVHPPAAVAERLRGEPKTEIWYFAVTSPGAAIYVGLRPGVKAENFKQALLDGTLPDLLHRIPTEPGSYIFLPSGRIHAIDAGNVLFEVQQNSDTTYRVFDWNRTDAQGRPRELHVDESLESINFNDSEPQLLRVTDELLTKCEHFQVECWDLTANRSSHDEPRFAVFQCVYGSVQVGNRTFRPGDLFLIPAAAHPVLLEPGRERTRLLRTTL
jgi:mannose-6-phosphate isomerase